MSQPIVIKFANSSETAFDASGGNTVFVLTKQSNKSKKVTTEYTIDNFGGVGKGRTPSAETIAEVDTLVMPDENFFLTDLSLAQVGQDLVVKVGQAGLGNKVAAVTLKNFNLEDFDNLRVMTGATVDASNINASFSPESKNSFNSEGIDVFDADSRQESLYNKNSVTFLNQQRNVVFGLHHSNDVINAQGGKDKVHGRSGDDLLRGEAGNDKLVGGFGNDYLNGGGKRDTLIGGQGEDFMVGGAGADRFIFNTGKAFKKQHVLGNADPYFDVAPDADYADAIADFVSGTDKIVLDKTTFTQIVSQAGKGFSEQGDFAIVKSNAAAKQSSAFIVYNQSNGNLFYNQNGSAAGLGSGAHFVTLQNQPFITAADFVVRS